MKVVLLSTFILLQIASFVFSSDIPPTYVVTQNGEIDIPCKKRGLLEDGQILNWISPNDMVILPQDIYGSEDRFQVDKITGNLTIFNVTLDDKGGYMCLYKDSSLVVLIARCNLNVIPILVPGTLFNRYQWNLTIGIIAAAVALSSTLLLCLIYQFRWKPENIVDKEKLSSSFDDSPAETVLPETVLPETVVPMA